MPDRTSPAALEKSAADANKFLPEAVNEITQLTHISAEGRELTFHYRLTLVSGLVDATIIQTSLSRDIANRCANKQLTATLRSGVRYRYIYTSADGVELARAVLEAADCAIQRQ